MYAMNYPQNEHGKEEYVDTAAWDRVRMASPAASPTLAEIMEMLLGDTTNPGAAELSKAPSFCFVHRHDGKFIASNLIIYFGTQALLCPRCPRPNDVPNTSPVSSPARAHLAGAAPNPARQRIDWMVVSDITKVLTAWYTFHPQLFKQDALTKIALPSKVEVIFTEGKDTSESEVQDSPHFLQVIHMNALLKALHDCVASGPAAVPATHGGSASSTDLLATTVTVRDAPAETATTQAVTAASTVTAAMASSSEEHVAKRPRNR